MEKYNFYERNKKGLEKLPSWSLGQLIGCVNLVATELADLPPDAHPDFVEMLKCSKKEFEKHIKLKTQHSTEGV